ncbi:MAG TPA: TonB-dependent receptor [Steroidobacteraceae bacterium]|nr:TonB-dependent receptor [Steroidobacteraceae bacterium]
MLLPVLCVAQDADQSPSETVIVSAQRRAADIEAERALTPGNVTTVDGEALYERGVTNLADVLRYVPGIFTESFSGSDELFYSSRGSNLDSTNYDKNGIKLLQDGLPITTADGNSHNRVLDPLSARYATVAHGANGLAYGASTLGGAIDFTSPTARDTDPLTLFVSGGSHGQLNGQVSGGVATESFDALATVEARDWDGYREHSSQRTRGVFANAGWKWSDSLSSRVFVTALDMDAKLPGALTRAEAAADPDQQAPAAADANYGKRVDTRRVAVKTTWNIDAASSLDVGLSYERQSLYHPIVERILVDFDGPGPAAPVEVFSLLIDTDHRDTGASLRYHAAAGAHDVLIGANAGDGAVSGGNYRNLHGQRNGLTEYVDDAATSLELFALDRWQLAPRWTLVYGGQWVDGSRDVRTVNAATGATRHPRGDYSSLNPRLGAIRQLGEHGQWFANLSRVHEAPTNMELEDDVRGDDATLDAMRGEVLETGVRGEAEAGGARWRWDATIYYARLRGEILSIDDPLAPGNSLSTNIGRTTHAGVEALVAGSFAVGAGRLEPLLSLTVNEFSFDSDPAYGNNDLPAAPRHVARAEVMYRRGAFQAGPTLDLVGRRYADFANTYEVGSHTLFGLRAAYSSARWESFAELRNLTDVEYISAVNVLNQAGADARVLYPGAPRSAYAGVRLKL